MKEFKLNRYEVDAGKVGSYNGELKISTLSGMMRRSASLYADRPLFGEKVDGAYRWMTYAEFNVRMLKMRAFLKKNGLGHGDRLAIIASNSIAFALLAYAAYGLGAVIVPMYEVQSKEDWRFIFNDANPKMAVVRCDAVKEKLELFEDIEIEHIFVIEPERGKGIVELSQEEEALSENEDSAREEDLCDIIYTSGTTGRPHGVELTHHNVAHDVMISAQMFDYGCEDRVLSFLPWAHGFGKTVDFTLFPAMGAAVGLAESPKTIAKNLTEVNPTVLCAVPKIFTRIYEQIHLKLESSPVKRVLFRHAQSVMHKGRTGRLHRFEQAEYRWMDKLVAEKVRAVFGNSLKFCVSGGASLSREIAAFFEDFGVRIFEGYGMTEHSPVISINYLSDKIGSVGKPLPTVRVDIEPLEDFGEDGDVVGEIVLTSECVMKGYHNDPKGTAEIIDEKGRLHTGDMGYVDEDGFLYITGRVKEQYKLANGKYVVPTALEEKINAAPEIDSSVVVGCGRPYNIVILKPSESFVKKFPASKLRDENSEFRQAMSKVLERVCADFRGYEKPQRFIVTFEAFTVENGMLTPALKIRRHAVEQHFSEKIDALYS